MTPQKRAPLEEFNVEIVQVPLRRLLTNMDRELERRLKTGDQSHDRQAEHSLSLLLIMLRFTSNSYEAICFLLSTTDDNPKVKSQFALVVPPANRQLLDLLFTLVYMKDDFPARSLAYELSGYRQLREESEIGLFVLSSLAPEEMREAIEKRTIRQYAARHFSLSCGFGYRKRNRRLLPP